MGGSVISIYDEAVSCFQCSGLLYAAALFRGPHNKALEYALPFKTHIPRLLGLPNLTRIPNFAEGVVIRPVKELLVKTRKDGIQRPLIKRKIEQFSEAQHSQAKKWDPSRTSRSTSTKEEKDVELMRFELAARTTPQRLANTLSKLGPPTPDKLKLSFAKEILFNFSLFFFSSSLQYSVTDHRSRTEANMERRTHESSSVESCMPETDQKSVEAAEPSLKNELREL